MKERASNSGENRGKDWRGRSGEEAEHAEDVRGSSGHCRAFGNRRWATGVCCMTPASGKQRSLTLREWHKTRKKSPLGSAHSKKFRNVQAEVEGRING